MAMLIKDLPTQKLRDRALTLLESLVTGGLGGSFMWDETKEGQNFWELCDKGNFEEAAKLFPEYFTEDEPEVSKLIWKDATQSKPSRGERVLLKISNEDCPVVGYWGIGGWEVCTYPVSDTFYVNSAIISDNEVTHYAELGELPK